MGGDDNEQGGAESLESLQERLTAHGRKLAEAAQERVGALGGSAAEEARALLGGMADKAQETVSGTLGGLADGAQERASGLIGAGTAALGLGGAAAAATADAAEAPAEEPAPAAQRLDLEEPARLPWLESADDDDYDDGIDTRRVAVFVGIGLALLAAIVGGIWWTTHRGDGAAQVADGSLIKAPAEPYKTAPTDPGGKTYEGTGDTSFAVSQGKSPTPSLATEAPATAGAVKTAEEAAAVAMAAAKAAGGAAANAASAAKQAMAPAVATVAGAAGGYAVQVGAYTTQASAEAGWAKLQKQYAPLGSVRHRIVQGQADIGTVYRLQAVTESEGAANALCSSMKGQGLACQVKR